MELTFRKVSGALFALLICALIVIFFLSPKSAAQYSVSFRQLPEIGDEIIVTFETAMTEERAKAAFSISPAMDGDLIWFDDAQELHFIPFDPILPETSYTITMDLPAAGLAMVLPGIGQHELLIKGYPEVSPKTLPIAARQVKELKPLVTKGKFIDVNLYTMTALLYRDGEVVDRIHLAGKGNPYTQPTKEGLFKVLSKEPKHFSGLSHVWMPWSMRYSGNYFLHAWPYYPNGQAIGSRFSAGCVRFFEDDAKRVYDFADVGTPVYVHSTVVNTNTASDQLLSGDLVREYSGTQRFIVRYVNGKQFKRPVGNDIEEGYGYYVPVDGTTRVIPDGTLAEYEQSNWIRVEQRKDGDPFTIFYVDLQNHIHKMPCASDGECRELWRTYGWDYDAVYDASQHELNLLSFDAPFELSGQ